MRIRSPLRGPWPPGPPSCRPPSFRSTLLVLALTLPFPLVRAADVPPLVVAMDVTLGASDRAAADSTISRLVAALPPDAEIALITFDDVVRHVVALAPAGAGQLDEMDAALAAPARDVRGNIAVGIERALDELGERRRAHVMVFGRARVGGEDDASRARFADWYREILLPDARAREIAITLVAPPADADPAVLADIGTHPADTVLELAKPDDTGPGADLLPTLLRRLRGDAGIEVAATGSPSTTAAENLSDTDAAATSAAGVMATEVTEAITSPATGERTTPGVSSGVVTSSGAGSSASPTATAPAVARPAADAPSNASVDEAGIGWRSLWLLAALAVVGTAIAFAVFRRIRPAVPATPGAPARAARRADRPTRILAPTAATTAVRTTPRAPAPNADPTVRSTPAPDRERTPDGFAGNATDHDAHAPTRDDGTIARFVTRRSDGAASDTTIPRGEPPPSSRDEHADDADATARHDRQEHGGDPSAEVDELELLRQMTARRNRQDPID